MSIYILIEYIEESKAKGIEPTFEGLHKWKEANWREKTLEVPLGKCW